MYNFVDINETSEGVILPSEALCLNGEYIENLIPGYRTLYVEGREALSPELDYFSVGSSDGATPKSKRYPERIITITYQLIAKSSEDFREAYNQLGKILNVEEAELIFRDEPDKFFKGTPSSIGAVPPGKNAITGTFEILCVDPFKYSLIEYEAESSLDDSSILLDYAGTYKAYPTLVAEFYNEDEASEDGETTQELTGSGDCGYVAFFNENEKIIQLGDPDEADIATNAYPKSQTLINQQFNKANSWGSAAKKLWTVNNGVTLPSSVAQNSSEIGMLADVYETPITVKNTSDTLISNLYSEQDEPEFVWSVTCKSSNRTANSVKIAASITAKLSHKSSYFGKPYILTASLKMGGVWRTVTMKAANERWEGQTAHTKTLNFTLTGLSSTQTAISGNMFKAERPDTAGQNAGAIKEMYCADMPISAYATQTPVSYHLTAAGSSGSGWHGATISRNIPVDANGDTGAISGIFGISHKMYIGEGKNDITQKGAFQVLLSAADGTIIGGFCISKTANGKTAKVYHYIGESTIRTYNIDLSFNNPNFGNSAKTSRYSYFKKVGGEVTVCVGGSSTVWQADEFAETAISKVTVSLLQYGKHPALMRNGINWVKFVKYNCQTWKDIPNKFSTGDIVEADCKTGDIYFNGVRSPEYGALGNDWEDFCLTPGLNQIGFSFSDWVDEGFEPKCKIRYREVFL